ncbi:MAG: hypothetical protein PHH70_00245 [Candidatus Gracilibacteria bacterium]|nr:hypothetical protein [Candidatus Gracilibacteria bacterium]
MKYSISQKEYIQICPRVKSLSSLFTRNGISIYSSGQKLLIQFDSDIEALILGCTHYPIIRGVIENCLPGLPIIDPGFESAVKFREYLGRHPDIEKNISRGGEMRFFTSGDMGKFREIREKILRKYFQETT